MSKTIIFKSIFHAVVIIAAFMLTSCSSAIEVVSSHADSPVQINGDRSDWAGNLVQSDDKKVAFGFRNDQQSLYLLVTTADRATAMKMLLQGMTVKISSDKGEELVIRYPMKPLPDDLRAIRGNGNKDEQPGLENFVHELKKVNDQIQVVTKDDYPIYTSAAQGKSLKGNFGMTDGLFVVEMQIPLSGDEIAGRLFPVYPQNISINFATGKSDFQGMRPEGGAGKEGGNGGMGRGGGRGNRGGERPGGRGGERPDFKALDYSFKVKIQQ